MGCICCVLCVYGTRMYCVGVVCIYEVCVHVCVVCVGCVLCVVCVVCVWCVYVLSVVCGVCMCLVRVCFVLRV